MAYTPEKKLSMAQFEALIHRATPKQLSRLAVRQLPDNIPDSLADEAPMEVRSVVEELIFEATAYQVNLQIELESQFGTDMLSAMALSQQSGDSRSHLLFKSRVRKMVDMYTRSKKDPRLLKSEDFLQLESEAKRLLEDLRQETGALAFARHTIEGNVLAAGPKFIGLFKEALSILTKRFQEIERTMNLYFYVSVMIAANEMNYVRDHIIHVEREASAIKIQVDEKRETLAQMQSNPISRRTKKALISEYQESITQMLAELKSYEVVISENKLLEWLDVVVEASLSAYVKKQAGSIIRTARLGLFGLLQKYCLLQEDSARQVARNPFSQVDPKKTIMYMLRSEQFILDYFAKKKERMTSWLGGAAQNRIDSLAVLERQLISEMRKNQKRVT
ncbi:hypothetical protein GP5015_1231 [gamma proteobacterium HTCC5015]|nr:hypothetical protein GP5015_1231 [gamma proteobacterium HTCC5015]